MRTMILLSPDDLRDLLTEYGLWDDFDWNHEVQVESTLRKMCETLISHQEMADAIEKTGEGVYSAITALEKADDELKRINALISEVRE